MTVWASTFQEISRVISVCARYGSEPNVWAGLWRYIARLAKAQGARVYQHKGDDG